MFPCDRESAINFQHSWHQHWEEKRAEYSGWHAQASALSVQCSFTVACFKKTNKKGVLLYSFHKAHAASSCHLNWVVQMAEPLRGNLRRETRLRGTQTSTGSSLSLHALHSGFWSYTVTRKQKCDCLLKRCVQKCVVWGCLNQGYGWILAH